MSFQRGKDGVIDLTGNFNSVDLSGSIGIAGSTNLGIWYTTNTGKNWNIGNLTTGGPTTGSFDSVSLYVPNGIAGSSSGAGIYYTTNNGQTWQQSDKTDENFATVSLYGSNGIACSRNNSTGIWYTTNYGQNWQNSDITNGFFWGIILYQNRGIATSYGGQGIFWSNDSGATWTPSNLTSGGFFSVSISGTDAIAASFGAGIYYSHDSGENWSPSNITTNNWFSVSLSGDNGIAGSFDNQGIYYTTDKGETWTISNITTGVDDSTGSGSFRGISLSGLYGIAGSTLGSSYGLYKTLNGGKTWSNQYTNVSTGDFSSVSISGLNAIAGSESNLGIYYTSSPFCYDKKTLILINKKGVDVYKRISELKVGDLVKTYKDDYKKIKMIKSFKYNSFNIHEPKKSLYKMKNHNVIVTGKHGILVDDVTAEELNKAKVCGVSIRSIKDKKVVPACASNQFEIITEDKLFELWHFVLENNNIHKNYGIYITDGILSESCSEEAFNNSSF
jgi:hypothetical protein